MARGSLLAVLELRGKSEFIAGLRDVQKGVRTMVTATNEVERGAAAADSGLSRLYSTTHLSGFARLSGALGGIVTHLRTIVGLGAGFGAYELIRASISDTASLQTAITKLNTQARVPTSQLGALRNAALHQAPGMGASATDYANLDLYHVESAFQSQHISVAQATTIANRAAQLARIGSSDLETTSQAVVGTVSSGIRGGANALQAASSLNALVGSGDMRMDQAAEMIATGILPTAKTIGLAFSDIGSAVATMTDNVTPANTAALKLNTSLLHMVRPTKEAANALASVGMGQDELALDMRKPHGLLVAIGDLRDHLDHLPGGSKGVQANAVTAAIFGGTRGSTPIYTLLDEYDRFASKYPDFGKGNAEQFEQAWSKTTKTFSYQKDLLVNEMKSLAVEGGTALLPFLGRVTGDVTGFLPHLKTGATDFVHGKNTAGAQALGFSPSTAKMIGGVVTDIESAARSAASLFQHDILPLTEDAAKLFGGAFGIGLHLLSGTLGFMAAHEGAVKGVLEALLAVYAVKKVGDGLAFIGTMPAMLGRAATANIAWADSVDKGASTIAHPIQAMRTGLQGVATDSDAAGKKLVNNTEGVAGRVTTATSKMGVGIAGITGAITGFMVGESGGSVGQGLLGALGAAAAGFMITGGPWGAAIGGFAGITSFMVGKLDAQRNAAQKLEKQLETAAQIYQTGFQAKGAGNVKQQVLNTLTTQLGTDHDTVTALNATGLTAKGLTSLFFQQGSSGGMTGLNSLINAAEATGKVTPDQATKIYNVFDAMADAALNADALSKALGVVSTFSATQVSGPGPGVFAGPDGRYFIFGPTSTTPKPTAGPTNRSGGNRAFGGWMVPGYEYTTGEHGPEKVSVGVPSYVTPHTESQRLDAARAGGVRPHISVGNVSVLLQGDDILERVRSDAELAAAIGKATADHVVDAIAEAAANL